MSLPKLINPEMPVTVPNRTCYVCWGVSFHSGSYDRTLWAGKRSSYDQHILSDGSLPRPS